MPNHVKNKLTIECGSSEAIQHVIDFLKSTDGDGHTTNFDFNKVIPMPESLDNVKLYGHTTWHDWRVEFWGTKWNAYETEVNGNTITFETAWSASTEVTIALSEKFPGLTFTHSWSDEDFGYNVGSCVFVSGECVEENIPDGGSKEAYEMAFEFMPEQRNWYDFDGETYQYNDDKCEEWYENN